MKRLVLGALAALALLLCAPVARAQKLPVPVSSLGFCFRLGAPGDQAISASCTVTVYDAGTTNLATIYSTTGGASQINPFTAATNGTFRFYVPGGASYDVRLSGGNPAMTPYTITNVSAAGGISTFSSGNLSPLFTTSVANPTTAPALSFSLSNAAANTVFGRCTGTTGAPSYCSLVNAMLPAPGSSNDLIYNTSGLFDASSTHLLTWDNSAKTLAVSASAGSPAVRLIADALGGKIILGTSTVPFIQDQTAWQFEARNGEDFQFGPASEVSNFVIDSTNLGTTLQGKGSHPGVVKLNDGNQSAGVFSGPQLRAGFDLPNGNHAAPVGSIYMYSGGAAGTAGWLKTAGTGNTGWVALTPGGTVQTCGTAAAGSSATCAETDVTTSAKFVVGTVALSSGTPSTATITSMPAFTGTNSYACTATEITDPTKNLLSVTNVSATSITITGPNTITDVVSYQCLGN